MFAKTMIFVNRYCFLFYSIYHIDLFSINLFLYFFFYFESYPGNDFSAINPIIYSACSMKFRREFRRMLTCGGRNNFSSKAKQTHRTFNKSTKLRQLSRSDAIALNLMSDLDDSTSALRSKRVKQLESNCKTFDCTDRIAQQHRSDSNDSSYLPDSANHSDQSNQPIAFNHQKNVRFVRKTEYDSKNFKNSKGFH